MIFPKEILHNFAFAFDLSSMNADGSKAYRCSFCGQWTDNPDANKAICPQRQRRKMTRRQKDRRVN